MSPPSLPNIGYQPVRPGLTAYGSSPQVSQYSPPLGAKPPLAPVPPTGTSSRLRLVLQISATTLGLVLVNVVVLLVLLAYIFMRNKATLLGLRLLTTGDANVIGTVTQAHLKVIALSIPVVMATYAYRPAALWLKSGAANGPTPTQLGLSLSVLGGANIMALVRSIPHHRRPIRLPPFLKGSLFNLVLLLALDGALTVVSIALNGTITSVQVPDSFDYLSSPGADTLSRAINQTQCQEWEAIIPSNTFGVFDYAKFSCGVYNYSSWSPLFHQNSAIRTLRNSSDIHAVAWTDKGSAILISSSTTNFSYVGITTGYKTTCKSVTAQCTSCPVDLTERTVCSPVSPTDFRPRLDCFSGGIVYNTTGDTDATYYSGFLNETGHPSDFQALAKNPLTWGDVASSQTYWAEPNFYTTDYLDKSGWAGVRASTQDIRFLQLNVLMCSVEIQNVTFGFVPPDRYIVIDSVPSDTGIVQRVMNRASDGRIPNIVKVGIDGAGIVGMSYADTYAQQLSKAFAAESSYIHEPTRTLRFSGHTSLGTDMSVILLGAYVGLSLIIALYTLAMGGLAAATCGSDPLDSAAQAFLVSPLHVIQQLHGTASAKPNALHEAVGEDMFAPETDDDRLELSSQLNSKGSWFLGSRRAGE